ncbi:hypothetical protein D918_06999 [Trichuris suis]|uniref:Retrovirus-related Pol polyprotein from transposon TNT 1-94-like beta-barrel domain-containing protein n=1 Tax=Trichuris suis TaxID=68888 RepID=A0A085M833_9BILA|nr:hypothetical protein M513_05860 [Trichuris suis]KHJ42915.1 hypothetical protein D918_06999 [Trichuris suis]
MTNEKGDTTFALFSFRERISANSRKYWCVDSGASSSMSSDRSFFATLSPVKHNVYLADGRHAKVTGIGNGRLTCALSDGKVQHLEVRVVLYVPSLNESLLSVKMLDKAGYEIEIRKGVCTISKRFFTGGSNLLACAKDNGELYELDLVVHRMRSC